MTRQTLHIGMVGYKFMGRAHAMALARIPMVFAPSMTPVRRALCGRDTQNTLAAAARLGFETVDNDWRALVKRPDIDILDVVTPPAEHLKIVRAAAEHGKHVFCEKPLALTLEDSRAMLSAVRAAGVKHQIGFNYRFCPALILAKRMIEEGKLGTLRHVRGSFLQDWLCDARSPRVWRLDKSQCGSGSLGDLGAHVIDAALWLAGGVREVCGMSKTFVSERPAALSSSGLSAQGAQGAPMQPVTVDDATIFACEFDCGALGVFEATRFAQGHKNDMRIEINGDKGSIRFGFERMNELEYFCASDEPGTQGWRVIQVSEGLHPYWNVWWPVGHVIGFSETFCHELFEFCECVANDRPCAPDFEAGVRCAQVMCAAELAVERRAWVAVESV